MYKLNTMIKGNLRLIDREKGIVEFYWNKYYPQTKRFKINGDTKDLFHRWFWSGDTTACISNDKHTPYLGWGKQITILGPNGFKLTGVDQYEYLRYKGPTKIDFQIEHVLCV